MDASQFLTTAEVARRLGKNQRTIRAKVAEGVFLEGKHFFKPKGSQLLWDWDAVAKWVRGEVPKKDDATTLKLAGPVIERRTA